MLNHWVENLCVNDLSLRRRSRAEKGTGNGVSTRVASLQMNKTIDGMGIRLVQMRPYAMMVLGMIVVGVSVDVQPLPGRQKRYG